MRQAWIKGVIICGLALLAGCGQKGPLFIPDKTGSAQSHSEVRAHQASPALARPIQLVTARDAF